MEESLELALREEEPDPSSWAEWAMRLPALSPEAAKDLDDAFGAADFRTIDAEMWE